jgi:hypothetical protein
VFFKNDIQQGHRKNINKDPLKALEAEKYFTAAEKLARFIKKNSDKIEFTEKAEEYLKWRKEQKKAVN